MATVIHDPQPAEIAQLIARREELGLDRKDEVWDGEYHMMPPPSLAHEETVLALTLLLAPVGRAQGLVFGGGAGVGASCENFRVPDIVFYRPDECRAQWTPSAALAVEVLSPRDTAPRKLEFYAAHHVGELLYVDPAARTVSWMVLSDNTDEPYAETDHSPSFGLGPADISRHLGWV